MDRWSGATVYWSLCKLLFVQKKNSSHCVFMNSILKYTSIGTSYILLSSPFVCVCVCVSSLEEVIHGNFAKGKKGGWLMKCPLLSKGQVPSILWPVKCKTQKAHRWTAKYLCWWMEIIKLKAYFSPRMGTKLCAQVVLGTGDDEEPGIMLL